MDAELESLLHRAGRDEPGAADELFALLYEELHLMAERKLRGPGAALTLGPTTLLHEAWLDMAGRRSLAFPDQARFLAYVSRAMRGLVIDYARRRRTLKRGRALELTLAEEEAPSEDATRNARELEELGDALDELAKVDPRLAELVDLHFFCGLSFAEVSALRGVSERTVQRDWRKARLLRHEVMSDTPPAASPPRASEA